MQQVAILQNKARVFIDFAHSPDALENVLHLARKLTNSKLIVLFGCGGDRDAKKRPIMGKFACDLADLVIVTDDNPRSENPAKIRKEILAACDLTKVIEIENRKDAIEKSLAMLANDDILILAGKGHEKYQIIGDKKFEFDEEKIVKNALC
jgi:UDP-N-acetylmuramoyl-L-alanyl-D-glutamate--2,6-diaminopimelate ligase